MLAEALRVHDASEVTKRHVEAMYLKCKDASAFAKLHEADGKRRRRQLHDRR